MFRVVGLTKCLFQNVNVGGAAAVINPRLFSSGSHSESMPEFKRNEIATKEDMERVPDRFSHAMRSHKEETAEEFDQRFIDEFNREDVDSWYIRRAMTALQHSDVVPEPAVVAAAFRACRRVNDYALAVRFLESIKVKCGNQAKEVYPYVIQEAKPIMDELGILSPEEMGYDKPEFHIPSPDWWPKEYYQMYGIRERTLEELVGPVGWKYGGPAH